LDISGAGQNRLGQTWFELPCVPRISFPDGVTTSAVLNQSGGRLSLVPSSDWERNKTPEVFFSTGDFQVLATHSKILPRGATRLLGSVLKISKTGKVTVVASGLRNPQGLGAAYLDGAATLLATSHGPRGGDTLNLVQQGQDYGWPRENYGTAYGPGGPPVHNPKVEGALKSSTAPAFAWVPSIGPSSVIQVQGPSFGMWWGRGKTRIDGDLLLSGMGSKSLYRVRWQSGAVRYVETIPVGERVRSLTQMSSGTVVAGTDSGRILLLSPISAWSTTAHWFVP